MPIIATTGSSFTPCPPGVHQGVAVDVIDYGMVTVEFQGKKKQQHKIGIVWQVEPTMDDGRPFAVRKRYTLTLDERGNLRKDLQSWRGKPFTDDELKGFDIEVLIGVNCLLNVTHTTHNGKTYANVDAIMPIHKGIAKMVPTTDYTRVQDRPTEDATSQPSQSHSQHDGAVDDPFGNMADDDSIPF